MVNQVKKTWLLLIGLPYNQNVSYQVPSSLKRIKKGLLIFGGILYGVYLFFTHCHAIGAFGKTGDDETIDRKGALKLLAALKS